MALTLAMVELGSLFAVCSMLFLTQQPNSFAWPGVASVLAHAFAMSLCVLVTFYYNDLYDLRVVRSLSDFVPRLLQCLFVAFILLVGVSFALDLRVSGEIFFLLILLIGALLLPLRAACYSLIRRRVMSERLLILGSSPLATKIACEIETASYLRYSIVGLVSEEDSGDTPLEKSIERFRPDRVILALSERRGRLPVWHLLRFCLRGVRIEDGVEVYERLTQKLAIESLNPSHLLFSRDFRKPKLQIMLRRVVSLGVAVVGLFVAAPVMLIIAALIKLESKGPVFFVQERGGRRGRTFRLVKFRTMYEGERDEPDSVWSRDVTSRITPVGRWLRRLRLDELPQFINILRGHMDLVGPRPEMASNVRTMVEEIPYFALRSVVRPGVTGWAQVKHGYSVTRGEVTEKIRYDLYYIKHMSFWFDLRILVDTVKIVLFGRGA